MSYLEGIGDEVLFTSIIATALAIIFLYTLLSSSAGSSTNVNEDLNSTQRIYQQVRDILGNPGENPQNGDVGPEPVINNTDSDGLEPNLATEQTSNKLNSDSLIEEEEISEENETAIRLRRIDFFENEPTEQSSSCSVQPKVLKSKASSSSTSFNGNVQNTSSEDIGQTEVANSRSTSDNVQSETTASRPNDSFNIRLKFLDDREQLVSGRPTELIGDFKRCHFGTELSHNKIVRLITNGQVLQDSLTLSACHLTDGCVVHVQISNLANQERRSENNGDNELDLGQFLWPIIGIVLGCLWALHYHYRDNFNTSSTIALLGLSGLFLTVMWAQYSRTNERQTTGNSM